ncbi:unnamed protein product, partial [Meganyctiphanes norvegica]
NTIMRYILNICTLFYLTIVYGDVCKNQEEGLGYAGCAVYKIESKKECPLAINNGEGSFVFYIKAQTQGQLAISLHESFGSSSNQITSNLFTTRLNDDNEWHKIKISKGDHSDGKHGPMATYFLHVDDLNPVQNTNITVGNEIRVNYETSLWTSECDPREYTQLEPPGPTTLSQSPTQQPSPSLQPQLRVTAATTVTGNTTTMIIAAVSLLLILVAILVIVILVLKHRRRNRDQAMTQPTDHQNRLSRHVSENSLYGSYDNQGKGENQVQQDTSATNSANQRRGSAHDSENSLYGGIN